MKHRTRPSAESICVFHHGTVILPDRTLQDGAVLCREGRISAVGPRDEIVIPDDALQVDARGGYIAPGFVDSHSHGAGGADFMDGTAGAVVTAHRRRRGRDGSKHESRDRVQRSRHDRARTNYEDDDEPVTRRVSLARAGLRTELICSEPTS